MRHVLGIDVVDEFDRSLAVWNENQLASDRMFLECFTNEVDVSRVVFDQEYRLQVRSGTRFTCVIPQGQ
jgi:hypothetical protein